MKKLIVFLFVVTTFGACKKKEVVTQEPEQAVARTYTLNSFRYTAGGVGIDLNKVPGKLPNGSTLSGTVTLTPEPGTPDEVSMVLTLKVTGEKADDTDFGTVEVRKTSEGYGLYVDDELIADADSKNIISNYSETNPETEEKTVLIFVKKSSSGKYPTAPVLQRRFEQSGHRFFVIVLIL